MPPPLDGPAVTIDPWCPEFRVLSVYAAGPASDAAKLSPTTARASPRPPNRPTTSSPAAATSPPTSTAHRSHGR